MSTKTIQKSSHYFPGNSGGDDKLSRLISLKLCARPRSYEAVDHRTGTFLLWSVLTRA